MGRFEYFLCTGDCMIWLDAARVVSILAVVFLHVAATVVTGRDVGSPDWWYGNVYDSLVRWCVPVFIMISGALLLGDGKRESVGAFYRKRMTRIFVPLLVWTIVFLFWQGEQATFSLADLSLAAVARRIASGKPHYHMWFLFMIVSLYLFTPFIRILVRHATRAELWLLVALLFGVAALHEVFGMFFARGVSLFVFWFLSYLPYYLCGHLIATSDRAMSTPLLLAVFCASVLSTALGCYVLAGSSGIEDGLYFYGYLSITVIPMSVSLMWLLRGRSFDGAAGASGTTFRRLSELTLGIYLIHPVFLELFRRFAFRQEDVYPLVSVPFVTALVFGASLLCAAVLYRIPYLKRAI
jgi:surface polysaccharide O-acyltransferase-like enzyme